MAVDKKAIFDYQDTIYKKVQVEQWGGLEVIVRSLSAKDKLAWAKRSSDESIDDIDKILDLLARCCVDDEHNLLFCDEDIDKLANKSAEALMFLSDECLKVSGLYEDAGIDEAKNS